MESGMDEKRVECGKQHLKQKRVSSESTQIVARDILWVTLSVLLFIKGSNCCASLGRAAFFFFFFGSLPDASRGRDDSLAFRRRALSFLTRVHQDVCACWYRLVWKAWHVAQAAKKGVTIALSANILLPCIALSVCPLPRTFGLPSATHPRLGPDCLPVCRRAGLSVWPIVWSFPLRGVRSALSRYFLSFSSLPICVNIDPLVLLP